MSTIPVTPVAGLASEVTVAGTPVNVTPAGPSGGFIVNPLLSTDQGLSFAEVLYVNPVGAANTAANGTTFALQPGQVWELIPGQTTLTSVNSAFNGHKFSVVYW